MGVYFVNNVKSGFIILGLFIFATITFIALHQPPPLSQQISSTTWSDEKLLSVRVDDFIDHISEKLLESIRTEKLICPSIYSHDVVKDDKVRMLYIITPTYKRAEQLADLTRLSHTLMHVPSILWLIIEDAEELNPHIKDIATRSAIPFIHLVGPMPKDEKKKKVKARGVSNRNRGLRWIRENNADPNGVIYFADDDNTYDLRLFDELRRVVKLGMVPVGLITSTGVSSPIVENGKVSGFYDGWLANRKFPVDMAGFAFSVKLLLQKPKAEMPFIPGYEEDKFLQSLGVKKEDIEPLAKNCTQIYVWHTQTKKNKAAVRAKGNYTNTNIDILYDFLNS